jgi:hypothetical protein
VRVCRMGWRGFGGMGAVFLFVGVVCCGWVGGWGEEEEGACVLWLGGVGGGLSTFLP